MPWAKIDDQMPDHPKIAQAGPLASWLNVCAICYSSRMLTDGFVPYGQVRKLADIDDVTQLVTALLTSGLWEQCAGGYRVHDYLKYNPSRAEVLAQRAENAKRQSEWRKRQAGSQDNAKSNADSNAVTNGATNTYPVPTPVPVPSYLEESDDSSCPDSGENAAIGTQDKPRKRTRRRYAPESEHYQLAVLLDERIHENNPEAKPATEPVLQRWSDEARLMIERDGRTVEGIRETLLWSQQDEFWRTNILSMGALRDKYDRLAAKRLWQQRQPANGSAPEPLDVRRYRAQFEAIKAQEQASP